MQENPATAPVISAMPLSRCRRSRTASASGLGADLGFMRGAVYFLSERQAAAVRNP